MQKGGRICQEEMEQDRMVVGLEQEEAMVVVHRQEKRQQMSRKPKGVPQNQIGKEIYEERERLTENIFKGSRSKRSYIERIRKLFQKSEEKIKKIIEKWTSETIEKEYARGAAKAEKETPQTERKQFKTSNAQTEFKKRQVYLQITNSTMRAYQSTFDAINAEVQKSENITIKQVQASLEEKLKKQGVLRVEYNRGRSVPIDAYAEMVARTARQQTFNRGALDYAQQATDLVYCTVINPTCEICTKFQGRVYSVSGNSAEYPALYETALRPGYESIHPNCRHQFIPYFPEFEKKERREKLKKESNTKFKDDRTENNRKNYQRWQEMNAEKRAKKNEQLEKEME